MLPIDDERASATTQPNLKDEREKETGSGRERQYGDCPSIVNWHQEAIRMIDTGRRERIYGSEDRWSQSVMSEQRAASCVVTRSSSSGSSSSSSSEGRVSSDGAGEGATVACTFSRRVGLGSATEPGSETSEGGQRFSGRAVSRRRRKVGSQFGSCQSN
jgi:hypothetical protein